MHTNTTHATTANDAPHTPIVGSADVELQSIVRTDGGFTAIIAVGGYTWQVQCTSRQLQTFAVFQGAVVDQLGPWLSHRSQGSRHAFERREDWQQAVAGGFEKGTSG